MICRRVRYFTDSEMIVYYQKGVAEIASLWKLKTKNYARCTILQKLFLMIYIGTCECYENIRIKLWSTISILKPWHCRSF